MKPKKAPCNECPFMKSTPLTGSTEWVADILKMEKENLYFSHSCHKTDPKADGFLGTKERRECAGHIRILMNDIDKTQGLGGVYESRKHLVYAYLEHWLGTEELEKLKKEAKVS